MNEIVDQGKGQRNGPYKLRYDNMRLTRGSATGEEFIDANIRQQVIVIDFTRVR